MNDTINVLMKTSIWCFFSQSILQVCNTAVQYYPVSQMYKKTNAYNQAFNTLNLHFTPYKGINAAGKIKLRQLNLIISLI